MLNRKYDFCMGKKQNKKTLDKTDKNRSDSQTKDISVKLNFFQSFIFLQLSINHKLTKIPYRNMFTCRQLFR